jgi:metallo-beta-lactamase family protein
MTTPLAGNSRSPTVTFWGAARTVTGSMHLVEAEGRKILLDCGSFRGRRDEPRQRRPFPFAPSTIDAVVLSHAHSDHCGNLPLLVRQGFTGPIYCTSATGDLLAVMLSDAGRVHEEDARVQGVVGRDNGNPAGPLYSREDVRQVVGQCVPVEYDQPRAIVDSISLRLVDAGHILGAAMVSLTFHIAGRECALTFTGDLGRRGLPLVRDPAPVPPADLLICESTYGGRTHQPLESLRARLADVVTRTAARGGKVLIPAFSLGRAQAVVHSLHAEMRGGRAPDVPILVDSPLAADVSDVYQRHQAQLGADGESALHDGPKVHYVRDRDESHQLGSRREPCVLVASGGMCEGGRILQHLKHHIDDPRCSVVLVSYQAPGTPGRQLLERGPTVRFHGRRWNKWAEVVDLNGFSGHADHDDLLASLEPLVGRTRKVCLVHGEPERAEALAQALRGRGFARVSIPAEGESAFVDQP